MALNENRLLPAAFSDDHFRAELVKFPPHFG